MHRGNKGVPQLLSLLQELSERIVSANAAENDNVVLLDDEDPVQNRFRVLLNGLLETYFIFPVQMNVERDILAVLKLIAHTSKQFPGVFFHGNGDTVIPILAHIFPLFAEKKLRSHCNVIIDAILGLLSLLHNHQPLIYNLVVEGIMKLLIDVSPLSITKPETGNPSSKPVCVTAFKEAFQNVFQEHIFANIHLNKLSTSEPQNRVDFLSTTFAYGVPIDLSDDSRWTSLASCTMRLLNAIIKSESFHPLQMVHPEIFSALELYLNYPCPVLHKACFDLICAVLPFARTYTVPFHKIMLSLICILSISEISLFSRDYAYNYSLGQCLYELVRLFPVPSQDISIIFKPFIQLFPSKILEYSMELKVFLCESLYIIMQKYPYFKISVSRFFPLLHIPEIAQILASCIGLILERLKKLNSHSIPTSLRNDTCPETSDISLTNEFKKSIVPLSVREINVNSRFSQHANSSHNFDPNQQIGLVRLIKMHDDYVDEDDSGPVSSSNFENMMGEETTLGSRMDANDKDDQISLFHQLCDFISSLNPSNIEIIDAGSALKKLTELSAISFAFKPVQSCNYHALIQDAFTQWMTWASENDDKVDISCAHVNCLITIMNNIFTNDLINLQERKLCAYSTTSFLLKPWISGSEGESGVPDIKLKIFHFFCCQTSLIDETTSQQLILCGLNDPDEVVREASLYSILIIAAECSIKKRIEYYHKLCTMVNDESIKVSTSALLMTGYMYCLVSSSVSFSPVQNPAPFSSFSPHLPVGISLNNILNDSSPSSPSPLTSILEYLCGCFKCRVCDYMTKESESSAEILNATSTDLASSPLSEIPLPSWAPLFRMALVENTADDMKITWMRILPRFLNHSSTEELSNNKQTLLDCIESFPIHPNPSIRFTFNRALSSFVNPRVLKVLFSDDMDDDSDVIPGINTKSLSKFGVSDIFCVNLIRRMLKHFSSDLYHSLYDTLLDSIATIAIEKKNKQISFICIAILIDQLDANIFPIRIAAVCTIERLVAEHISNRQLKDEFNISKSIIEEFYPYVYEYLGFCLINKPNIVNEFAQWIMQCSYDELLVKILPAIIPKLVLHASKSIEPAEGRLSSLNEHMALSTLQRISNQKQTSVAVLLLEWCPLILSHVFLNSDGDEIFSVLRFVHSHTSLEPASLFSSMLPSFLYQLLVSLGDDEPEPEVWERRSKRIATMIQEVSRILTESDDLASFLKEHLLGLLNNIDLKLLRGDSMAKQFHALDCIDQLIRMIGCHLSTFSAKFISLLSFSFRFPHLHEKSLSVWLSFVRTMADVAPSTLKSSICQIVVSLFPCFDSSATSKEAILAVKIFDELLINNKHLIEEKLKEIPLLPAHPSIVHLNSMIENSRQNLTLKQKIRLYLNGLDDEPTAVKLTAAKELKLLLMKHSDELHSMVISPTNDDDMDVMNHLIKSLLHGCGEGPRMEICQELKLICAECFGEIGAIDPFRIPLSIQSDMLMETTVDGLAVELISSHLCRVLQSASEPEVQDAAALVIQELLKLCGVRIALSYSSSINLEIIEKTPDNAVYGGSNTKPNIKPASEVDVAKMNQGQKIWSTLSDHVKEMIQPCLTSNLTLKLNPMDFPDGPIYKPNLICTRWLYLWYRKLVQYSQEPMSIIFYSCLGIIRHDIQTVLFLIKYLVWNVVCLGSDLARESVKSEILAVLSTFEASMVQGYLENIESRSSSESTIQVVFTILDFLDKWLNDACAKELNKIPAKQKASYVSEATDTVFDRQANYVKTLLSAIPKLVLAKASFRCKAYSRSLQYLEDHIRETTEPINPAAAKLGCLNDKDIAFLIDIYSGLDDVESVVGLSHLSDSMNLNTQIAMHEKAGRYSEALTYYEQILETENTNSECQMGLLQCLLKMGHWRSMLAHADGLMYRMPTQKKVWSSNGIQAAWRLGEWDLLDEYVNICNSVDLGITDTRVPEGIMSNECEEFDIGLARILQSVHQKDESEFKHQIMLTKMRLLRPLTATAMESYSRTYPTLVKLHMLRELEDCSDLGIFKIPFASNATSNSMDSFITPNSIINRWEKRSTITQASLEIREPIFALQRLLYDMIGMRSEAGKVWLQYAKLCRRLGHYQTANRAILESQARSTEGVRLERAKLFWAMNEHKRAISELQDALKLVPGFEKSPSEPSTFMQSKSKSKVSMILETTEILDGDGAEDDEVNRRNKDPSILTGKMVLKLAIWIHESRGKHKQDVIAIYRRAQEIRPYWDKAFFHLAKFYDDLLSDARKRQEEGVKSTWEATGKSRRSPASADGLNINKRGHSKGVIMEDEKKWWMYIPSAMFHYGNALSLGSKFLFHAMPRILTLWFEFCSIFIGSTSKKQGVQIYYERVFIYMKQFKEVLSSSQWLSSLPQLVSRLCHPNEEVVCLLKEIILLVLRNHPQQALWIMAAVCKSKHPERKSAASEIVTSARESSTNMEERELYIQFPLFIDQMIKLCNYGRGIEKTPSTLSVNKDFSTLKRMMPLNIILPIQTTMAVYLPCNNSSPNIPNSILLSPVIYGMKDKIAVMNSLQKPKKVVFIGNDGKHYGFLCKPKDDLRKDARMMEFTSMLNHLFSKDSQSRKRKLYIRTFSVLPLTEDCGMVEWVNNTQGLRHILQDLYAATGLNDWPKVNANIKQCFEKCKSENLKGEMLRTQVLPMFPPVFHRWFTNSFPEPSTWFRARQSFCHTVAVWSMVGHIVGLGDRHGENILLDSENGDCVHVDFSCLFDKGLLLQKPEVVPFRLTQNMVDGLGVTGYEGLFTYVCTTALSVLRANREVLMTVLETLIHDPLVEWEKSNKSTTTTPEVHNFQGKKALANIDARLKGVVVGVGAAPSLPLSVQGQVQRLIGEAVSISNLGRMYIWWMPWF